MEIRTPRWLPGWPLVVASMAAAAAAATLTGIWDPDFFHHLAVGRALARGTSFAVEPFLWPFADAPSGVPSYWLGSLALYVASIPAGPAGGVVLAAIMAAVLFAVLVADAADGRREPHRLLLAFGLVALAIPELRIRSAPRPEMFGVVFLAFTLLAARRFEQGRPRLLLAFPLVALLWAQVHLSVAMGLGVVGLLVLSTAGRTIVERSRGSMAASVLAAVRFPAVLLAGAAVASAITPPGAGPVWIAWRFLLSMFDVQGARSDGGIGQTVDVLRQSIDELQPPLLSDWGTRPFGFLVGIALLSFVVHRSRGWLRELATVLAFAAFASTAYRFTAMAAYVAAPIAARNLGGWLDGLRERRPRAVTAAAALASCAALAIAASAPVIRQYRFGVDLIPGMHPVRAAAYLRDLGFDGRLYNDFGSGGYLEWTLDRPVFQDGRGLLRRDDLADALPQPVDPERMARLDSRHHFDALVFRAEPPRGSDRPLGRDVLPDRALWSLVAFDERAAVYLRRDGRFAAAAARDEFRLIGPDAALAAESPRDPPTLAAAADELARAAREAPGCASCRVSLAEVAVQVGRLADAEAAVRELRAMDVPWFRPAVEVVAATLAQRRGDLAEAEARYRAAIRSSDNPAPIRRLLASLLVTSGRATDAAQLVAENLRAARDPEDLRLAATLARGLGDHQRASALEAELAAADRRAWARARTNAGAALVGAGRRQEALAAFAEAVRADGGYAPARTHLGLLLLSQGQDAAAFAELSRAVEADPDLGEAWFGLAQVRERRGDRAGAAAAYRRYLALRPDGDVAAAAQARLAALSGGL